MRRFNFVLCFAIGMSQLVSCSSMKLGMETSIPASNTTTSTSTVLPIYTQTERATIPVTPITTMAPTPLLDLPYGFKVDSQFGSLPTGTYLACWDKTSTINLNAIDLENNTTYQIARLVIPNNVMLSRLSTNGVIVATGNDRTRYFIDLAEKKVIKTIAPNLPVEFSDEELVDQRLSSDGSMYPMMSKRRIFMFMIDKENWVEAQFEPFPSDKYSFFEEAVWSFDGNWLAFWYGNVKSGISQSVFVLEKSCFDMPESCASKKIEIIGNPDFSGPLAWTPDNDLSVIPHFQDQNVIDVYDIQSHQRVQKIILPPELGLDTGHVYSFFWSPDNKWILFNLLLPKPNEMILMPIHDIHNSRRVSCDFAGWLIGTKEVVP